MDIDTIFIFRILWKIIQIIISFWIRLFQTMLSFIISKVNKHRIDSTNKSRRGVSDVQNIDMHSVVSQINLHGTTIASVSGAIKLNFLLEYLRVMSHEEFATICFSRNCNQLLHHLQNNGYDFVSPGINGFDPFFGFSENEICSIIRQSVSSINGISITNDAIQYLRGVLGYLSIKGIPIGLQNISRCIQTHLQIGSKNYDSLIELIEYEIKSGSIDASDGTTLQRLLLSGQRELSNLQQLFLMLNDELTNFRLVGKVSTVLDSATKKKLMLIDTSLFQSNCLFSIIANSIDICKKRGISKYVIIIDETAYEHIQSVKNVIHRHINTNPVLFVSDNIYSLFGGNENEWRAVIGGATTLVIGKQNGSESAKKISEHFGQYEKYVITHGKGRGTSHAYYQLFSGSGQQNAFETLSEVEKPKVSVSDLMNLKDNELLITDIDHDQIYHISITV